MQKSQLMKVAGLALATAAVFLGVRWRAEIAWLVLYELHRPLPEITAAIEKPPVCNGCNLILVSLDTLRADRLGAFGATRHMTPNLDGIAARSLAFVSAFTPGFFTTPAHMSLFTSTYPNSHKVQSHHVRLEPGRPDPESVQHEALPKEIATLAEVLKTSGYHTVWRGPLHSKFLEMADGFGRGFEEFHASAFTRGISLPGFPAGGFDASSLEALSHARKPAFYFFHSYVNHAPFLQPDPAAVPLRSRIPFAREIFNAYARAGERNGRMMTNQADFAWNSTHSDAETFKLCTRYENLKPCFDLFDGDRDEFWHGLGRFQIGKAQRDHTRLTGFQAEEAALSSAYDAAVRDIDRQAGQLWEELEKRGLLKNSVVIFFSDHGQELFEHGGASHATFYEHTARVPLMVYVPGVKPSSNARLISLVDVMPMILDLLGIAQKPKMQGSAPWNPGGEYVFGYSLGWDMVRDRNWKLMRDHTGKEHLFYLPADAAEVNNLVELKNPAVRGAYARLVGARSQWLLDQSLLVSTAESHD
jgi:arylsulfatase A-like enzyme